jgi:hypothetical protein
MVLHDKVDGDVQETLSYSIVTGCQKVLHDWDKVLW